MAQGDQDALSELYDRHARALYSLALRILQDSGEAEDIVQEVFAQAWRQANQYDVRRGVAALVLSSEQVARVRTSLCTLPALQRSAIRLAYYEGLSHAEVAARHDQPLVTVMTRIRLGILKLRE